VKAYRIRLEELQTTAEGDLELPIEPGALFLVVEGDQGYIGALKREEGELSMAIFAHLGAQHFTLPGEADGHEEREESGT
jgi:hypothetical protein